MPALALIHILKSNFEFTSVRASETGEFPAGPWVRKHSGRFYFALIIFLTLQSSSAFPADKGLFFIQDFSFGGGASFGKETLGFIQGNARMPFFKSDSLWRPYYGFDLKISFPEGANAGFNLGIPVSLEYRRWGWRPFVMSVVGYGYVKRSLLTAEVVFGGSIEVKALQGMRFYGGWSYIGGHGVILGILIFLAW